MPEKRRKFDREFREGAVRIVRETNKPIAQVAAELGINAGTLANWVNQDKIARGEAEGLSGDERAELARLSCGERRVADGTVVDALAANRQADALELVFEYMAATQAETGKPIPTGIEQLPEPLRHECDNLTHVYRHPGTLLLAYRDQHPIGCVGLAPHLSEGTAEIKRLYVRPAHRGGVGRMLMDHAHHHAARRHFTRLILDVLPTRTAAINLYRRLGYVPYDSESPTPMTYMQRVITQD